MPVVDGDGNYVPGATQTNKSIISSIKKKLLPSKYDKQHGGKRYDSGANMCPKWIVIHNVGPGSASACYNTFADPGGRDVSTHFTCDDKQIIQMLECSWRGIHTNGNAMSAGGCKDWADGLAPAVPCSASNADSIGIEVGNNGVGVTSVDEAKALEVAIELTRYLMTELNIDADHVVRHGDTQPKNCPSSIMKDGGKHWVYFKEQIVSRNAANQPVELNVENITAQAGTNSTASPTSNYAINNSTTLLDTPLYGTPTDIEVQLPDVDHRENTTNMDEVKGLSIMYYPPYNSCELYNYTDYFTSLNNERTFHYGIGKVNPNTGGTSNKFETKNLLDELVQTKAFTDNDTHTYIDRVLFKNKRERHNITVALMCPSNTTDYPAYERALIEGLAILLHEHALEVKDLWREFDLNKAPSPFLYLELDHWKDLLAQVEIQLEWRKKKYGTYTKTFEKYLSGSSGLSGGSTGSITTNPGSGSGGGSGTPLPPGDTTLESENQVVNTIYKTFISKGLTPEATCGIIGNIFQESGFNPTAQNPKSGAWGLCQWLHDRLTNLKKFAASLGKDASDVEAQCLWAWEEANGKDSTTKSRLNDACGGPEGFAKLTDVKKAVDIWRKCFERCGENEAMDARRYDAAMKYYNQVKSSGSIASLDESASYTIMPRTPQSSDLIVFVGDSLTVGLGDAVSGARTFATKSHTVWQGYDTHFKSIVAANPGTIFMSYGTNDAGYNNASKFITYYKKFIQDLKKELPNVNIYINKIFPGNQAKASGNGLTCIKGIPLLNDKLNEIATAGATVIDCTNIPNLNSYYSDDGIHFKSSFYTLWYNEMKAKLNDANASSGTNPVFGWPCPGIDKVSSKFGPRVPPCAGASSYHGGIDIGAKAGTSIKAFAAGTVIENVSWHKSAGNYIKIDHGNGVATRYLHMQQPSPLSKGSTVESGQEVGKVGNTGIGTGAHLHFEIHINGEKVDPLGYVKPGGGTTGKLTELGDTGGSASSSTGGLGGTTIGNPSDGLLYGDQKQESTNAPIGENSAGGEEHDDWGGIMIYTKGDPTDPNASQPKIETIITQEMFLELMQYSDQKVIDDYTQDFDPYGKGLASIDDHQITLDERINALTKTFKTSNENTFHYKVIESGPGSKNHCVTIAEELNYLVIPDDLKVEPIYPDLVIPPGYVSTDSDKASPNTIPVAIIEQSGGISSDAFTKQMSYDYDLLKDKKKESNKTYHPVNYADPYPYDEKITDLEKHYPKVFIDEVEGQLYSCNHPGCPISQPMAKNFAMLTDAMIAQSKRTEQRLSKLENILSTVIRNQGRLGSRMNINCVYYGGHSTFNKYKCIRCLHDDRIHDGELVTIDQCLNCTRFEPILGQIYNILDDSGLNSSIILDDMQMSYTDLEGFKNLNDITHRSSRYFNAAVTAESNCKKPDKSLTEVWKEADKKQYLANNTDAKEETVKEEDYIFKMDWNDTFFNSQEPDTKKYPNEGITTRYKAELGDGEGTLEDELALLDPEMDKEAIKDIKNLIKIRDNIWVDTRETADSIQSNKYTSENFFFEDFNKVRIGKYGINFSSIYGYNGEDYNAIYNYNTNGSSSSSSSLSSYSNSAFASQTRDKIVEMAKIIYQECVDGKAWYSQANRTVDYTKPGYSNGKKAYDCTSLVSCCYLHAGLKSMYSKSCSGGTLIREIMKGGKMWPCNEEGLKEARPGDVIVSGSSVVSKSQCDSLSFITISHAMIYIGDGKIIHASNSKGGIKCVELGSRLTNGKNVFCRPADLIAADGIAITQNQATGGVTEATGTVDGMNYVARIPQAVVTAYKGDGQGSNGPLVYNSHCASHNLPYGTKVYIPSLADKAGNGIYTVQDTGGCFFDFDIYTTSWSGKQNMDAYILEWGTGKTAPSYTWAIDLYNSRGTWKTLVSAWNTYKNMGGKLISFTKYNNEDANIKNHKNYND